jgi:hypothetical protein
MKFKNECVYKNVCNGCNQKCRSCQLKFAPYDKSIAAQLKKEIQKSKHKFDDDREALAADIMCMKSKQAQSN